MLNTIYTGFDDVINRFEAYKVETIGTTNKLLRDIKFLGDAYMVVSGIPQENDVRHLMNLSEVTLEIMKVYFKKFFFYK